MKKIELYTAVADRAGKRREAGEVLSVGTGKGDDIAPDVAAQLVANGSAVEQASDKK